MITRDELAREMQAFASVLAAARAIIETQGWDEDEEGVLLRALESARAALKAAIRAGEPAPASLDEIWQELIERDDRPSPEKYPYPDMVLITKDELGEFIRSAAPAPAVHQGVCYREGPPTPEDYDEAIIDLMNARNQRISMARGEFQGGCAVCGDSGHTVNGCHHDPLQLARERARQKSTWQCYHCGFEARTDEDAIEHFGRSEEEVARCLRPAPAVPVQEEAQNVDNFSKWYSENEDGLPSSHKYACEAAWNAALAAPAVQWTDEQVERARKKLWVNEVFAGPKLVRAALEAASKDV